MLDDALLQTLAQQIHDAYVAANIGSASPYLVPWAELPPNIQESNESAIRDFLVRLEAIGMVPEPYRLHELLPANLGEAAPLLAELGHLTWVHRLQAAGWRYGAGAPNPVLKTHPALMPWATLTDRDRQKEFALITQVPLFLQTAGYVIVTATSFPDSELPAATIETLAEALHETYQDQRRQFEETVFDNAAMRPWPRLEDTWKEANRAAAQRIGVVLGSVGCTVVPVDVRSITTLEGDDWERCINALAQVWHRQWLIDRTAEGWVYGTGPKNLAKRTHPDLVSWADLGDAARDKSRAQVHELPGILARAHLVIARELPRPRHRTIANR